MNIDTVILGGGNTTELFQEVSRCRLRIRELVDLPEDFRDEDWQYCVDFLNEKISTCLKMIKCEYEREKQIRND